MDKESKRSRHISRDRATKMSRHIDRNRNSVIDGVTERSKHMDRDRNGACKSEDTREGRGTYREKMRARLTELANRRCQRGRTSVNAMVCKVLQTVVLYRVQHLR